MHTHLRENDNIFALILSCIAINKRFFCFISTTCESEKRFIPNQRFFFKKLEIYFVILSTEWKTIRNEWILMRSTVYSKTKFACSFLPPDIFPAKIPSVLISSAHLPAVTAATGTFATHTARAMLILLLICISVDIRKIHWENWNMWNLHGSVTEVGCCYDGWADCVKLCSWWLHWWGF